MARSGPAGGLVGIHGRGG